MTYLLIHEIPGGGGHEVSTIQMFHVIEMLLLAPEKMLAVGNFPLGKALLHIVAGTIMCVCQPVR